MKLKLLIRFLIIADIKYTIPVDAFIHGEYEDFIWATRDEVLEHLMNKELSLKEFKKTYDMLGIHFDSIRGEASYVDSIDEVINMLEAKNKLEISEGATIVDLTDEGIKAPCIVKKSDGSSIYASRDLAAILYRARTYDFDKCLYVVAYEQNLHFKQVFEVAKLLGIDEKYVNGHCKAKQF